ncbi:MAG: hypothetical protein EXS32_16520 [Opitutus sp.]|nr:hypothetical protein [Opitutus sp.]
MPATAKITLNVTMFNAVKDLSNANRFCFIDDPMIVDSCSGRVYTINGDRRTLRIKNGKTNTAQNAKPIDLEFTITPAGSYIVSGLSLTAADSTRRAAPRIILSPEKSTAMS